MDQDHGPETNDPIAEQPSEGRSHPSHDLFNAMLGKFKGAQSAVPGDETQPASGEEQLPADEAQTEPVTSVAEAEASVVEPIGKKRPWWHIFAVKSTTPEMGEAEAMAIEEQTGNDFDQQMTQPITGTSDHDATESGLSEPSDADAITVEPVIDEQGGEPSTKPKKSLLAGLRQIKEQLFPPATKPISVEQQPFDETGDAIDAIDEGWNASETIVDTAEETAAATSEPPAAEELSREPDSMTEQGENVDENCREEAAAIEPTADRSSSGLFSKLAFWEKHSPAEADLETRAQEPLANEDALIAAESDETQPISEQLSPSSSTEESVARNAPSEATVAGSQAAQIVPAPDEQPAHPEAAVMAESPTPPSEAAPGETVPGITLPLQFRIREVFIAIGVWFGGIFAALRPQPRGPIDQVLAAKLEQRRQLDREISARKRTVASLASKLRRGRFERKEALTSRGQATRDLAMILVTMKARAEDVQILEKQSMALQGEIQQADTRHQQQLREIDDSRLQWESLIQTIAKTKAQLDTVSVELGIKRNDAAHLDQLMEARRRELDAAVAETNRLDGVRKATEDALQEFRAQIARLDQDRNEKEIYVRQATAEMERIKQLMDQHIHQRDVMEGVLAQLQQDVSTRQNLMQQLLDDGVRVKTETDQGMAQKDMLSSAIQELTQEKEQLQQDMVRLREEADTLGQVHSAVNAQAGRATSELQRLEAECQERERRVADLTQKQEISGLLEQKIATMKDEGLTLAKKLDELRSQKDLTEKALNSYRRELATVDTDIAQKKEERQRLVDQAREADEHVASSKRELELYGSQKSQLSDAIEGSHQKLQTLEQQISQKQQEHATADQRLLQVRDALSQAEGEHARLQQAVADSQARLDDIAGQHGTFEQQLIAGRAEVAKLSTTGSDLVAEIERNTKSKASLIVHVQELKRIMAATSQENDKVQQRRRELESWIKEATPFQQQQQQAIEGQLAKVNELQRQAAGLNERIAADQARQVAINDDLAHLDQEKAIRSQSIEDELSRLNQRLAETQAAIQDNERDLQQRGEQRMAAVDAIQKLEEERDLLKQEVSGLAQQADKVRQLQSQADELTKMMAAGQKRLEEMYQENQKLAQDKAGLQQSIKQAEAEHHEARDRQRAFAEEVQQVQHNLESLRQTRDQLQDDLARQQESHQALTTQAEAAQSELDERQRKLDATGEELRNIEAEIGSKTATREQLDATIAQLKQQHADALAQVAAATGSIEEQKKLAQQQLEALTADVEQNKKTLAELGKSVNDKGAEEAALLKRLKMLSTEASQYQAMVKQRSELSRKIEEQKRVLEDLELQAEKKSGLFT